MSEMEPNNSATSVSNLKESKTNNADHQSAAGASKNVGPEALETGKLDSIGNHQENKETNELHMTLSQVRELRKEHAVQSDSIKAITTLTTKQEE